MDAPSKRSADAAAASNFASPVVNSARSCLAARAESLTKRLGVEMNHMMNKQFSKVSQDVRLRGRAHPRAAKAVMKP